VASSANRAGRAPPANAQDVLAQLEGAVDLLIDAGPTRYRKASTIVSFEHGRCEIVRAGVYDERMIRSMAMRRILFVCTGNTCRSPLAAAISAKLLAGKLRCKEQELSKHGVELLSAGTLGVEGLPAAADAVKVARKMGLSLAHHRSRKVTNELIHSADLIFCMSGHQVREVTRMSPGSAGRAFLLDADGDIADPIGGGEDAYQDVAGRLQTCLRNRMKEILP
jgi:protein-tyrosine-phosphatase